MGFSAAATSSLEVYYVFLPARFGHASSDAGSARLCAELCTARELDRRFVDRRNIHGEFRRLRSSGCRRDSARIVCFELGDIELGDIELGNIELGGRSEWCCGRIG